MISIKGLSKTFNNLNPLKVLDNVNLDVAEGDIVGIIGKSGAGKSTLVRCINLLERPDSGTVRIKGVDVTELKRRALNRERKRIGMIFQHFNLLSSRTVFDNIALPMELDRVPQKVIEEKVGGLLKIVGLEEKADFYPLNLSGGQKQRVAIARALANDPHLLLCDEATSALDPATTQSILALLKDINQKLNLTILVITHEMEVVKTICNQVAIIDGGRIVSSGTWNALLENGKDTLFNEFVNKNLTLPAVIQAQLKQQAGADKLYTLIEIDLTGQLRLEQLCAFLEHRFQSGYKLIKTDIEQLGKAGYGKLLLQLQRRTGIEDFTDYLINNNIKYKILGYV